MEAVEDRRRLTLAFEAAAVALNTLALASLWYQVRTELIIPANSHSFISMFSLLFVF
jgi:hypothetical protein